LVCIEPAIHIPLLAITIAEDFTNKKKRSIASATHLNLITNLVKGLSNCDSSSNSDRKINPIWLFQPTGAIEGAITFLGREKISHESAMRFKKQISDQLDKVEINNKNKNQIAKLKSELESFKSF
jgi:hypothetical protein